MSEENQNKDQGKEEIETTTDEVEVDKMDETELDQVTGGVNSTEQKKKPVNVDTTLWDWRK